MGLDEKFVKFSPRCHFNVEELSVREKVAFAIMIVLFESEKSPWSLRECFLLKGLCVPMMSHPGVEDEGLLLPLSQKNWGSGHGRRGGFRRVLPVGAELLSTS